MSRIDYADAMKNKLRLALLLSLLLLAVPASVRAMFMQPQNVPVDRLLKQAEAGVAKNPNDAKAVYTLARVHYLAFHMRSNQVPAFPGGGLPGQWMIPKNPGDGPAAGRPVGRTIRRGAAAVPLDGENQESQAEPVPLKEDELCDHALKALQGFDQALKLDPKNGLTALGRASLLDEFAAWARDAKPAKVPDALKDISLAKLRAAYASAFQLSLPEDSKLEHQPVSGIQSLTSYEAATALIRLAESDAKSLTEAEATVVTDARAAIAQLNALPMGAVTPIVFSFRPAARLADMLDASRVVDFDLRGFGWREQWTWVKPELGFLVWDPEHTGTIASARQLFGGYTFQIFRDTGYDALAALDDNHDGMLSGDELKGISVWFDRNGDGKSSPEEVAPLEKLSIVSVSVKSDSQDGVHPKSTRGITLRDGRTLPTWDWIAEPVRCEQGRFVRVK